MAHTPGPWPEPEYDNYGNGGYSEWWDVGGIARVSTSEADARLITAAPDLLAAGNELTSAACEVHPTAPSSASIDRLHAAIDAWSAAIAKATRNGQ